MMKPKTKIAGKTVSRPSSRKAKSSPAIKPAPNDQGQVAPPVPLGSLYFYLTEGCNLACRHCWIAPKLQKGDTVYPSLDFDVFVDVIAQATPLGLSTVKLTGGEPLMHPEIVRLLEHIRSRSLNLTVETNGVLCIPELARELAACRNAFVSVSLDGVDPETNEWIRGVPGCWESAVQGVKNLVAAGFRPQIILTLMRKNKDQVEAIVRLAESLGAGSVKFNVLQPTARGEDMHHRGEVLSIEELVALGRWVESDLSKRTSLRLVFHHPAVFRPLGRIYGETGDGCGQCGIFTILGVLSDGSYALCGIGESVPELVFGHARRDALADVWNNHPLLLKIREGLPKAMEGVCGRCLMKSRCLGSCVAQNYYSTKNLFAPFWYCDEAFKKGLFPLSRLGP